MNDTINGIDTAAREKARETMMGRDRAELFWALLELTDVMPELVLKALDDAAGHYRGRTAAGEGGAPDA